MHLVILSYMAWTASEIRELRERLRMEPAQFASLLGVDLRTAQRWETGEARPTGAAEAVMTGLRESLDKRPEAGPALAKFVLGAAAVGGLAYLIVKLFDVAAEKEKGGGGRGENTPSGPKDSGTS
ncbi:helix-turn-helix domain-containing protein [Archangium sp.]|uniref:helix-turn-helix domain-containing protein n=1 Tax=Archangium sp. TaxID=1872627 RepID=UPI002D23A9CB|nr:helix-turn-helix domain-containing protein [Archangium sp.]HYO51706.1 helix-turn-helix domain-containing protein [Archangium sp.]